MTIKRKNEKSVSKIEIDLTGPEGNAFFLLGTAKALACKLNRLRGAEYLDPEAIQAEMRNGDYENLVATFDKYFGEFVILYR